MLDDKIFCQLREEFHEALAESHEANVRLLVALLEQSEALLVASDERTFIPSQERSKQRKTTRMGPS